MNSRHLFAIVIAFGIGAPLTYGQKISDIPTTDPAYPMAINAVKFGYLSLPADGQFKPDTAITRKELSIVIDKLLAGESSTELSKAQIQELLALSKSFKTQVKEFENKQQSVDTAQIRLSDEQKAIHKDVSALQEQLSSANTEIAQLKSQVAALDPAEREKKERDEKTAMWAGIIIALLFGIFK